MASFVRLLKDTAPWSWIILLGLAAGIVAIAVTYGRAQKTRHARAWPAFVAPFAIGLVAATGFAVATFRLGRFVEAETVDRGMRIRVAAEGLSENLEIVLLAASISAILFAGAAITMAISALRHVWKPRFTGAALVSFVVGALLSVAALYARVTTMRALGMLVFAQSSFSPVIIPSLVACVVALLTGAALAGEGGGALGHASEEARDRELGADALAATLAAFGAVVLTLVAMQTREHSVVIGALSGESVDGAQRARILAEAAVEARAMVAGGAVSTIPVVLALALACLPRIRVLLRGTAAGGRAAALAVGAIVVFGITAPVSAWRAAARLDRHAAVSWPAGFAPVQIGDDAGVSDFQTDPVFVADDATTSCKGALDSVPTNKTPYMATHPGRAPAPIAVAVPKTTHAGKLHCLLLDARNIRTKQAGSAEDADRNADIAFVVRATTTRADVAVPLLTAPTRDAPFDEQLHLTRTGWKLRTRAKGRETGDGTPPSVEAPRGALLLVTADEDVDAQRLLEAVVATGFGGGVVVGRIHSGAFEEALRAATPPTPPPASSPDKDAQESSAPLPMLPQKGFGSRYAVTSAAVDPKERLTMEAVVREALPRCAKEKGAAHVTFKMVLEDDGSVTPTAKPADRRGGCLVNATKHLLVSKRSSMKGQPPRIVTFDLGEAAEVKRARSR